MRRRRHWGISVLAATLPAALLGCQGSPQTRVLPTLSARATSEPERISLSTTPISSTDVRPYLLIQLPGEDHLRGITWDASASGILAGHVPEKGWAAQADGSTYVGDGVVYDRQSHEIGALPWPPGRVDASWSKDGKSLCAVAPTAPVTGSLVRLETATLGQSPRVVASGFATYSDNASYPVLACDPAHDRAIVAVFGQGVAPGALWVFRLSTGKLIRSVKQQGGWLTASADGALLAESTQNDSGRWFTTVRSADDGKALATIPNFAAHAFSSDASLLVGLSDPNSIQVLEWKTGRRIWSSAGPYGGALAEPGGRRMAIGIGFVGGSDQSDLYIVSPDGTAVLLPTVQSAPLRY